MVVSRPRGCQSMVISALGLLIAGVGFYIVLADIHVAFKAASGAHTLNQVVGLGLVLFGGFLADPTAVGAALTALGAAVGGYLPWGRRSDDGGPGGPMGGMR